MKISTVVLFILLSAGLAYAIDTKFLISFWYLSQQGKVSAIYDGGDYLVDGAFTIQDGE